MYNLVTGDKDNTRFQYILEMNSNLRKEIVKGYTIYNIQDGIFNMKDSDYSSLYNAIAAALTIGDELKLHISYKDACYLFFALNVNAHSNSRVDCMAKTILLYNEFDGDYSKVHFYDNYVIEDIKVKCDKFISGVNIDIRLPFRPVYTNNGWNYIVADSPNCEMTVNGDKYLIPKKTYHLLLGSYYNKMIKSSDKLADMVDSSYENICICLDEAEFNKLKIEFPFENALFEFEDGTLVVNSRDIIEENEYWTRADENGEKYIFKRFDVCVPTYPKDSVMNVFAK